MSAGQPSNSQVTATPAKRGRFAFWRSRGAMGADPARESNERRIGLSNLEWWVAGVAFAAAGGVVLAYAHKFSTHALGEPRDWGAFGDYVGGLVNPICGLATAILVVLTLRATRTEADSTRKLLQEQIAQMKRDAESIDHLRRLDGLLVEWREHLSRRYTGGLLGLDPIGGDRKFFEGTLAELFDSHELIPYLEHAALKENRETFSENWRLNFNRAANLLREFSRYCNEYDASAGNRVLTDFYRHRLNWPARFLKAANQVAPAVADSLITSWGHGDIGHVVRNVHLPASPAPPVQPPQ